MRISAFIDRPEVIEPILAHLGRWSGPSPGPPVPAAASSQPSAGRPAPGFPGIRNPRGRPVSLPPSAQPPRPSWLFPDLRWRSPGTASPGHFPRPLLALDMSEWCVHDWLSWLAGPPLLLGAAFGSATASTAPGGACLGLLPPEGNSYHFLSHPHRLGRGHGYAVGPAQDSFRRLVRHGEELPHDGRGGQAGPSRQVRVHCEPRA